MQLTIGDVNTDEAKFARLCDEQLAAADNAATKDERIAHLELAFRFAQQAMKARTYERVFEPAD